MVVFPPLSGVLCPMLQEWLQSWLTVFPMLMLQGWLNVAIMSLSRLMAVALTITDQSTQVSYITVTINERVCDLQLLLFAFTCGNVHTSKKGNPSVIVKNFNFFLFGSYLLKNISQWFNYQFPYFYTWCVNLKVDLIYWWCVACWRTKV